ALPPETALHLAEAFRPTGPIDINQMHIVRDPMQEKPINCQVRVTCKNAGFAYDNFPYPLKDVNGEITFQDGHLTVGPMRSQQKEYTLNVLSQADNDHFKTTVTIKDLTVNDKVYQAMSDEQKNIWDMFSPSGRANATFLFDKKLTFENNTPKVTVEKSLDIELLDMGILCKAFPIPLSNTTGTVLWTPQKTSFEITQANTSTGTLTLAGQIIGLKETPHPKDNLIGNPANQKPTVLNTPVAPLPYIAPEFVCDLTFKNITLDDQFGQYLPLQNRKAFGQLNLTGQINGQARLTSQKPITFNTDDPQSLITALDFDINTTLTQGRLHHEKFPYPLENILADCRLTPETLTLRSLQASNQNNLITANGHLSFKDDSNFHIESQRLELNDSLRQAFHKVNHSLWDTINPAGEVKLNAEITIPAKNKHTPPYYHVAIEPLNSSLTFSGFNYPLTNITGKIIAEPDHITLHNITSSQNNATLVAAGNIHLNDQSDKTRINFKTAHLPIDKNLHTALSQKWPLLKPTLKQAGTLDFNLALTGNPAREKNIWNLKGELGFDNATLTTDIPLENISGRIKADTQINTSTNKFTFTGELLDTRLHILKRPLTHLEAENITYHDPNSQLTLSNISGNLCGGNIIGNIQINQNNDHLCHNIALKFLEADLDKLINAPGGSKQKTKKLQGKCNGALSLSKCNANASSQGRFSVLIKDATLWKLPITAQLLNILNLSLPGQASFDQARITGDINDNMTRFNAIQLTSNALTLTGIGTMTGPFGPHPDKGRLNLAFQVDNPQYIKNVPILDSFLKIWKPELVKVSVTGTFDDPEVKSTALPSLEDAIQKFGPTAPLDSKTKSQ
ncbi:MAG: DUF3971 domain-containing protein, partial [Phycisphaerae bacterium]|nr:DUF3971 domain-containing protein [Phycisphaerae bacterium]